MIDHLDTMDNRDPAAPSFADVLSFLAVFAASVNWADPDISLSVFDVALDDESYAAPQQEPSPGSFFQVTAIESIAVTERSPWRSIEKVPLPNLVALKIPHRDDNHDADVKMKSCLASLVKEIRILRNSYLRSHESVVSLLGVCWRSWDDQDAGNPVAPVLILELANEGDLAHFLSKGIDLHPIQRISLVVDICAGVQALHDVGIANCDVKPKNFLVFSKDDWCVVKIADFGGAVWEGQAEADDGELPEGTIAWRAPGRRQPQSIEDLMRADVYSLALVIWSVITLGRGSDFIADTSFDELEAMKLNHTIDAEVDSDFTQWLESIGVDSAGFTREENRLSRGMKLDPSSVRVEPKDFIRVFRKVVELLEFEDQSAPSHQDTDNQTPSVHDEDLDPSQEPATRANHTTVPSEAYDGDIPRILDAMASLEVQDLPAGTEDEGDIQRDFLIEIDRMQVSHLLCRPNPAFRSPD
jgi:serine/threonine protein kinase